MITEAEMSYKEMRAKVRGNVCAQCESALVTRLNPTRLECAKDPNHIGIEPGDAGLRRRIELEMTIGQEKAVALRKYEHVTALTAPQAKEIIDFMFPGAEDASPNEVKRAVMLCTQYGLNPLKKHIALAPFWNSKKKHYDYVVLEEIKATRLIASRKHRWTFTDFRENSITPRLMTPEEEKQYFGDVDPEAWSIIVLLKDLDTGAIAPGYSRWQKTKLDEKIGKMVPNRPKGWDKGNTGQNQASIRAERQAMERLWPADMLDQQGTYSVDERAMPEVSVEKITRPPAKSPVQEPPDDFLGEEPIEGEFHESLDDGHVKAPSSVKKEVPNRDLSEFKVFDDVVAACRSDFGLETPDILTKLGKRTLEEITDEPFRMYLQIKQMMVPPAENRRRMAEAAKKETATAPSDSGTSEKAAFTTKSLMEWAAKHGKNFTPSWVRKACSKDPDKDPLGCREELKALQDWKD